MADSGDHADEVGFRAERYDPRHHRHRYHPGPDSQWWGAIDDAGVVKRLW